MGLLLAQVGDFIRTAMVCVMSVSLSLVLSLVPGRKKTMNKHLEK